MDGIQEERQVGIWMRWEQTLLERSTQDYFEDFVSFMS